MSATDESEDDTLGQKIDELVAKVGSTGGSSVKQMLLTVAAAKVHPVLVLPQVCSTIADCYKTRQVVNVLELHVKRDKEQLDYRLGVLKQQNVDNHDKRKHEQDELKENLKDKADERQCKLEEQKQELAYKSKEGEDTLKAKKMDVDRDLQLSQDRLRSELTDLEKSEKQWAHEERMMQMQIKLAKIQKSG